MNLNKRFCDFATAEVKAFEFAYYELGKLYTETFKSTDTLGNNPYEWSISVIEVIDDVLSLKVGETMYLCAIRDDKQSKGVICRIK